jgi:hypothetical protein
MRMAKEIRETLRYMMYDSPLSRKSLSTVYDKPQRAFFVPIARVTAHAAIGCY